MAKDYTAPVSEALRDIFSNLIEDDENTETGV